MSHRSFASLSDKKSSGQNTAFKARSAKLKKYLMDLSGTSGKVFLAALKQALATNNIILSNNEEFLHQAQKSKHRVKVDTIMQWLRFDSLENNNQIIATMLIPANLGSLGRALTEPNELTEDFRFPRPPSRAKPNIRTPVRVILNPFDSDQEDRQSELASTCGQQAIRAALSQPTGRNYRRPGSANVQRNKVKNLENSALDLSIDTKVNTPIICQQQNRGRRENLVNRSLIRLGTSPQEEHSCSSKLQEHFYTTESPEKGGSVKPLWIRQQAYDDYVDELIHDLQKNQVQYEYVFEMLKVAMKLCQRERMRALPKELYEENSATLQSNIGVDLYKKIVEIGLDKRGRISPEQLSEFVDRFKYAPYMVRQHKNTSQQFDEIAFFGPKTEENLQKVDYNQKLLSQKIEEKFMKLGKAYRFFDLDKSGFIQLHQFKHGLDLLGMRLPDNEVKDLFDHLDRGKDGVLDYDEFCDLLEERRIVKWVKANHNVVNENEKPKPRRGTTNYSPYIQMIYSDIKENPKIIDYRKEENFQGPEYMSIEQKEFIARNPSHSRAPVGFVRKFYTPNQPCTMDLELRHGIKSFPSESMKDIMSNSYQREWQEKVQKREKKVLEMEERRKSVPKRFFNDATLMRNDFIKKIYERLNTDNNESSWQMRRFSNTGSKVASFRRGKLSKSSLNNSLNRSNHTVEDLNITML